MNQKQTLAAVEAMLFACGDPIGADKLAQAVQLPQSSVDAALETLHTRYQREDSGLCLLHLNTRWQLATKTQWADCVRRVLDSRRAVPLGPAAMEKLARQQLLAGAPNEEAVIGINGIFAAAVRRPIGVRTRLAGSP